jgi:phospholipid N-methyltransferase
MLNTVSLYPASYNYSMATLEEGSGVSSTLETFYASIATEYDAQAERNGWTSSTHAILSEALLELPQLPDSVLEFAPGTGLSTATLLEHCYPSRLIAVDSSCAMLDILKAKFENNERIHTNQTRIQEYFGSNHDTFDLVLAMGILHHLEKQELSIVPDGISRCLGPDSKFIGTYDPLTPSQLTAKKDFGNGDVVYWYPPEELEAMITRSGLLRVISRTPFHPQPHGNADLEAILIVAERY